jgi:hypothetical protein
LPPTELHKNGNYIVTGIDRGDDTCHKKKSTPLQKLPLHPIGNYLCSLHKEFFSRKKFLLGKNKEKELQKLQKA